MELAVEESPKFKDFIPLYSLVEINLTTHLCKKLFQSSTEEAIRIF